MHPECLSTTELGQTFLYLLKSVAKMMPILNPPPGAELT